jgi:MPBQ/MSBQ methyltransferase
MSMAVERHYRRDGLLAAIEAGLRRAGKDPARLVPEDLAPVDEFHARGRRATLELAARLQPSPASHVLDIGSGLGGPSRLLAAKYGCRVTGIDLTEDYCRVAATLSQWVGLADRVGYCRADALRLPFPDARFDAAWTQHVAMNIADKALLYREIHRVMRPGGAFALYDVLQGPGGAIHLPVPWAREASASHLVTPDALRGLLGASGFALTGWRDTTAEARQAFAEKPRRGGGTEPPLGLFLVLGADFGAMAASLRRNLDEERVVLIEAVAHRA